MLVAGALTPNSAPRRAVATAITYNQLLLSEATLAELNAVLLRPKFDRYLSTSKRLRFIHEIEEAGERVSIVTSIRMCRDPDDDKFLELAVSGNADTIVTGDRDLLLLNPFRGTAIFSPAEFLVRVSL